tara:strand:- start:436 stop:648 length:213 start_codon:yes stop_codon:yes gene_type:complete
MKHISAKLDNYDVKRGSESVAQSTTMSQWFKLQKLRRQKKKKITQEQVEQARIAYQVLKRLKGEGGEDPF